MREEEEREREQQDWKDSVLTFDGVLGWHQLNQVFVKYPV